jgi:hypothetical protein
MASRAHGREERRQEGYEEAEHRAGEDPGPGRNRQWFQPGRSIGEAQASAPPKEEPRLERCFEWMASGVRGALASERLTSATKQVGGALCSQPVNRHRFLAQLNQT